MLDSFYSKLIYNFLISIYSIQAYIYYLHLCRAVVVFIIGKRCAGKFLRHFQKFNHLPKWNLLFMYCNNTYMQILIFFTIKSLWDGEKRGANSITLRKLMIIDLHAFQFHIFLQEKENEDIMKPDTGRGLSRRDAGRNTLRRTLRRRVSMSVMRQKMKKLQDYSLPCQTDNFRFLRAISDYCNSPILGLRKGVSHRVSL